MKTFIVKFTMFGKPKLYTAVLKRDCDTFGDINFIAWKGEQEDANGGHLNAAFDSAVEAVSKKVTISRTVFDDYEVVVPIGQDNLQHTIERVIFGIDGEPSESETVAHISESGQCNWKLESIDGGKR